MFSNIKLFSRKNNKIEYPNKEWTINTKIYCLGILDFGFDEKYYWSQDVAPRLQYLIKYYKAIKENALSKDGRESKFEFDFRTSYRFELQIGKEENPGSCITIKSINWNGRKRLRLIKYGRFHEKVERFKLDLLNQVLPNTSRSFRNHFIKLLFEKGEDLDEKFNYGDKVETILGAGVKTKRTGYIMAKNQDKEGKVFFYIFTSNKIYEKRYFKENLALKEQRG